VSAHETRASKAPLKPGALQTLRACCATPEPREVFGLRAIYRRFHRVAKNNRGFPNSILSKRRRSG
jgi:hypothetical protein